MSQLNTIPTFQVPLTTGGLTTKDWYFFFTGIFRGLAPANAAPVALTGSPFTYTAPFKGFVIVTGGTVSMIEFSRDGTTFYNLGQTSGSFTLNSADQLRIAYSAPPTVTMVPT